MWKLILLFYTSKSMKEHELTKMIDVVAEDSSNSAAA